MDIGLRQGMAGKAGVARLPSGMGLLQYEYKKVVIIGLVFFYNLGKL